MPDTRSEWAILVVGLAVAAGLVFVAVRARSNRHVAAPTLAQPASQVVSTPTRKHAMRPPERVTPRKPKKTGKLALALSATGASTWIEVRIGSSTGHVLYSGTLSPGTRKSFRSARRFWVRFGGAADVGVVLDGRPLRIPTGTYDAFFDGHGFRQALTG